MPWLKIDDSFFEHPKVTVLSDRAFRVHIGALCYAARYQTDGVVPPAWMTRNFASKRVLEELTRSGVWEATATGEFLIHDFTDYNPRSATPEEKHAAKVRAGKAGAAKRWQKNSSAIAEPVAEVPLAADSKRIAPYPSRPDPVPTEPKGSGNEPTALRERPVPLPQKTVVTEEWLETQREEWKHSDAEFHEAVRFAMNSEYFRKKPDKRAYVQEQLKRASQRIDDRKAGRPSRIANQALGPGMSLEERKQHYGPTIVRARE